MIGIGKNLFKSNVKVGSGASYDADAQAYFTANTAITSDADKTAINDFYLGLKTDGIYTKIKAMYLPIWGSATSSKWNLLNPLDTDAAFRATFATGFTYSSGGITGNATSAYIDIYFIPNANGITQNSFSYGFYSRTNRAGVNGRYLMGANQTTPISRILARATTDVSDYNVNGNTAIQSATTNTQGFFQASRISSTAIITGKNTYTSNNSNSTGTTSIKFYVFAQNNNGTIAGYENVQCSFFYIGTGLTLTEMNNFKTRVNTLMTYFGINV
jgi:hypothetical protein